MSGSVSRTKLTVGVLSRPPIVAGGRRIAEWVGTHWAGRSTIRVEPQWSRIVREPMTRLVLIVPGYYCRDPEPGSWRDGGVRSRGIRWDELGRRRVSVAVISYGGVDRGLSAGAALRKELSGAGLHPCPLGLGLNVARLRDEGPVAFEEIALAALLTSLADGAGRWGP